MLRDLAHLDGEDDCEQGQGDAQAQCHRLVPSVLDREDVIQDDQHHRGDYGPHERLHQVRAFEVPQEPDSSRLTPDRIGKEWRSLPDRQPDR